MSNQTIEYVVAVGTTRNDLVNAVNKLISEGYLPIGGVAMSSGPRGPVSPWAQSMLRSSASADEALKMLVEKEFK